MRDISFENIPEEARKGLSFTDEPVIGIVLMNAERDSCGNPLDPNVFYWVGKDPKSGMLGIFPSGRNQKDEFIDEQMKQNGKRN